MKLLTFAVPCYNSEAYMEHCIQTLLEGGEDVEIILIDDGSKDGTAAIADRYAAEYPTIVKAVHQENGGHGEGVNQGLRRATGLYYKVVDSDDWADVDALEKVIEKLREFSQMEKPVDLLVCNYVYEHVEDNTQKVMGYANVFPREQVFTWEEIGRFRPSQYLLMHSVFYRTQLLRDCGLELPKHTFYVDNIFVFQPLTFVETLYYMDLDFYRYGGPAPPTEPVHVQLPGYDDDHFLHLPPHRRHPCRPGEEDGAVGVHAHGGPGHLPQDEVPGHLRRDQFPGLSGP